MSHRLSISSSRPSTSSNRNTGQSDTFIQRSSESFASGKYSDLTITCRTRRWKVHRLQLSHHSPVFEAMVMGHFKESKPNEAVDLPDDEEEAVNEMLRYMYHFKYSPEVGKLSDIVLHMQVARLADKYQMKELEEAAKARFRVYVKTSVTGQTFVDAVYEAFLSHGYDYFRTSLVQTATEQIVSMRDEPGKYKALWDAAETVPLFATEMLRSPSLAPRHGMSAAVVNTSRSMKVPLNDTTRQRPRQRSSIILDQDEDLYVRPTSRASVISFKR